MLGMQGDLTFKASINTIYHINNIKMKSHMIILIGEKTSDKILNLEIQRNSPNPKEI